MGYRIYNKRSSASIKKIDGHKFFIVIAFLFPVLLYIQTLNFGFTNFDDNDIIENNITLLKNLGNVRRAFLTDAFLGQSFSFYRPMQTISYMVDIQLSGGSGINTWIFHFSNIILFGLIACLLFLLLQQFFIPVKLALLSTLVFCAHPLFVSFVAWIPSRGDLLMNFFSLLSFLFFIKFLKKQKFLYLFVYWAAFTIAIFCKETAVLLPFLFIHYYLSFYYEKHFNKRYIYHILPIAVSLLTWFFLRSEAIGGALISKEKEVVGFIPLLSNLRVVPESLAKFLLPFDNNPVPVFSLFKTVTGSAIIFALIFIFFKNRGRSVKEKIFCFSWFIILMLPPMLYKDQNIDYLDHRFFLPFIGILLFGLFLLPGKWFETEVIKKSLLLMIILLSLSFFTFIKTRTYSDPVIFYNSTLVQNPNSAFAYNYRGLEKYSMHDFQGAFKCFNKAISIRPAYKEAYINRGLTKAITGDNHGAIEDYKKAIAINPMYFLPYYNIGGTKETMNDDTGAIDYYKKAINLNPMLEKAYFKIGVLKEKMGDNQGAGDYYNKAIEINPGNDQGYYYIGVLKEKMGDNFGAIEYYNKTIAINPKFSQAFCNRGVVNANIGNYRQALEDFDKAIAISPKYAEAYNNKGGVLNSTGNFEEAIKYFNSAIEINPKFLEAYENIAVARYNLKDFGGALDICEKVLSITPGDNFILNLKARVLQNYHK